jgi:hypothetical protein
MAEAVFLDRLRRLARSWPSAGVSSLAMRDEDDERTLVAWAEIRADGHDLLTFGIRVDGVDARADKLHNQLFTLPRSPTTLALATGSLTPDGVNDVGAWFEGILRRRVERWEWWYDRGPYAVRYHLADTREGLSEAYAASRAPAGQRDRLVAAGSFRGQGWIRTAGIGPPDRVVSVRVNGEALATPQLPGFMWYECPLEVA